MGWFDEQIRDRKQYDRETFQTAVEGLGDCFVGRKAGNRTQMEVSKDAVDRVIRFYGYTPKYKLPDTVKEFNEQLEYLCRPYGIMRHHVVLSKGWYKDAVGAMLAFRKDDGSAVALLPGFVGYKMVSDGVSVRVNAQNEDVLEEKAICFYRPLPQRKLTIKDMYSFTRKIRTPGDNLLIVALLGIVTGLGLLIPKLTNYIYSDVVEAGSMVLLYTALLFFLAIQLSTLFFSAFQKIHDMIIGSKSKIITQAAITMRVLSMPPQFFKQFSSGELSTRMDRLCDFCNSVSQTSYTTIVASAFSLSYIISMAVYAPKLVLPSLLFLLLTVGFYIYIGRKANFFYRFMVGFNSKESGLAYSLISGIQKIRVSGAEKRAFSKWANLYSEYAAFNYNWIPVMVFKNAILTGLPLLGTIFLYFIAVKNGMTVADYTAFNTALAMVTGAMMKLGDNIIAFIQSKPNEEAAAPILEAEPEISEDRRIVTNLHGAIELNNVSFRYTPTHPMIMDNLSLKIRPGEYVAVVGKTGCGKSTLLRLLLGFEQPLKGTIYYDGRDINTLDLKSLRQKIGVVLQNGKLLAGDILSNITLAAPWMSEEDAWKAAEIAGIAEDIRQKPLGMHTYISEGAGGISGGQRQRILIASAIAPKPRILIFDEATSALDNVTQKKVSDALDQLKCTRIVIAHRLSTIQNCDRILYLEDGKIAEEGTYQELLEKQGLFAELVARQRIE